MIGRTVAHYRIVDKLGEGGMGVVYKAEDTALQRFVALKFLPPELVADEERRERFIREARAASAINHPNIAQVYELGEHEGTHFIAMELIEGRTLTQLGRGKRLELDRLLEVMIQVADGLSKAHRKRIVHRDLKPENIMVDEDGRAKILDFGLAKLHEPSSSETPLSDLPTASMSHTGPHTVLGTPHYMSPEQARGEAVDRRSDVFSLGVVMYEMAAGQRPFQGRTKLEVISSIIKDEPRPISEINDRVPLQLHRIIHRALAKRRQDRYQDTRDLWVELRELKREMESGSSPLVSDVRPRARFAGLRRAWPWAAGAAAVVLAAIAGFWALQQAGGPGGTAERPSVAVLWFEGLVDSEDEDYLVEGMTEELITELWKIGGLEVNTRDDIRPFRDAATAPVEVARRMGFDYVLTGTIRRAEDRVRVTPRLVEAGSGSLVWTARFDEASGNLFSLQDAIALQIARELRVRLSRDERSKVESVPTASGVAHDHYLKGRHHYYRTTVRDNEIAVKEYRKALNLDPGYALAMAGLADAYVQRYKERYDYDEHWLDEAKRLIDGALRLDGDLAEAYESRAEVLLEEQNLRSALEAAERARDLRPDWDEPYVRLAMIHDWRGERRQALEMCEKALALRPSVEALCQKGDLLRLRGSVEEAVGVYEIATELNPEHHLPYVRLAQVHKGELRDTVEAERLLRKALAVRPDLASNYAKLAHLLYGEERLEDVEGLLRGFIEKHPYNWEGYSQLADFLAWWKGDYPAAAKVVQEAVARNPDRAWPHLLLASVYAYGMEKNPEPDKALAAVNRALELRPESALALKWAGDVHTELHDTEIAIDYYERALEKNPGSAPILGGLVALLEQDGEFEKAAGYARSAIRERPGQSWRYDRLMHNLLPLGRYDEYRRLLEQAVETYGEDDPEFVSQLSREQRMTGEFRESVASGRRALAMREDERTRLRVGISQWFAGDTDGAIETLKKVSSSDKPPSGS